MAADFQRAVNSLTTLQAEIAAVSADADRDWKRELVTLRRKLQDQLTVEREIAAQCEPLKRSPELACRLENGFSRMRSTLAYHQADWPAVRIDLANSDYLCSVATVRDANREFVQMANEIIELIEHE